jgi:Phosphoadenosine phosphosulfate reductase family
MPDVWRLDGLALLRDVLKDGPLAGRIALVSSFGAQSTVLLDMVASVDPATPVIFLDTLKLFPETDRHREALIELLQLRDVRVVRPEQAAPARRDPRGDLWQHDPDACCQVRKTVALQTGLAGFEAWITGRKRFQGGVRRQLPTIEPERSCDRIKINPLGALVRRGRGALSRSAQPAQASACRPELSLDRLHPLHVSGFSARAGGRRPVAGLGQVRVWHPLD